MHRLCQKFPIESQKSPVFCKNQIGAGPVSKGLQKEVGLNYLEINLLKRQNRIFPTHLRERNVSVRQRYHPEQA